MTETELDVIVVNDSATVNGGLARAAVASAAGVARHGHRVTFVAGQADVDPELAAAGIAVRHTGQHTTLDDPNRLRAAAQGVWNRRAAATVRELAATVDPARAVIHIHGFTKVLSASVVRAALESGRPTIVTLHDYFAACPNGAFFNYQTNSVCPLRPLSARCVATHCDARRYEHKLWRVARSTVQERFGQMPSGVRRFIVPSGAAATIIRPFLSAGSTVDVLPNPIPGERMEPAPVADHDRFVFVGRLQRDKDGVTFARAARLAGVPATFVGAGEQDRLIRRDNPDAELTGWLDTDGVRAIVRTSRGSVNPSLIHETQGLTVQEAAADGVPAIVSRASVASETVVDGTTGLRFRPGDVDDLADKLARLSRDPQLASRLGVAAYERFWADPADLATHVKGLERIYRAAIAGSHAAAPGVGG